MAEGRMLKKKIANSEKLGNCKSDRPRVLYFMILPHLDKEGRLLADPRIIKGQITTMLPYSKQTIQAGLEELHRVGLIILYSVNSEQYLEYTRFGDFQKINPDREADSLIPPPTPENSRELQRTPLKLKEGKVKLSKDKYTTDFEIFWKKFKGRWNPEKDRYVKVGKFNAWEEWQHLNTEEQKKAIAVADCVSGKFTPDACRWLKNRRFDDFTDRKGR